MDSADKRNAKRAEYLIAKAMKIPQEIDERSMKFALRMAYALLEIERSKRNGVLEHTDAVRSKFSKDLQLPQNQCVGMVIRALSCVARLFDYEFEQGKTSTITHNWIRHNKRVFKDSLCSYFADTTSLVFVNLEEKKPRLTLITRLILFNITPAPRHFTKSTFLKRATEVLIEWICPTSFSTGTLA